MIVGNDRLKFQASRDEKIGEDGFQFCLSALEIVTGDEHLPFLSQIDNTRNQGILRTTVDVRAIFQDRSTGEYVRRADLIGIGADRLKNFFACLIQTRSN